MKKFLSYFKESKDELLKVVWPTRKQVTEITIAVLILVVFIASLLGLFDYILAKGLTFFLNLKK